MEQFPKKNLMAFLHLINETLSIKPQILSIFHFDRVIAGQMAHISGVKWTIFETIHKKCRNV